MTSQGGEPVAGWDSSSTEVNNVGQAHASFYPPLTSMQQSCSSLTGSSTAPWNHAVNNPTENGYSLTADCYYDPQRDVCVSGVENQTSSTSHVVTSLSQNTMNAMQGYPPYASPVPYSYNAAPQPCLYGNYQQNASYAYQQVGANQNSGVAYQPLSSFPSSGYHVGPTNNSDIYHNAGDHQTMQGYENSGYYQQTNLGNDGSNWRNYPQSYSSYTPSDTNSIQSYSTVPTNSFHYQLPQYNQWSYYSQVVPNGSVTPGIENMSSSTMAASACSAVGVSGPYPYYPSNQPPPPGTTSWRRDPGTFATPSSQETQHINQVPTYPQNSVELASVQTHNHEDQQKVLHSQAPSLQVCPTNQVSGNFQPTLHASSTLDARRVSKIQIQTNPKIAPGLANGMVKSDKKVPTADLVPKPAYVSVPYLKSDVKSSATGDTEATNKGALPPSFCAYVERTFARCKNDVQRAATQIIMNEMVMKASADGTLFTKNWDMEPLVPLPNSSLEPTETKIPGRRLKSRWEPIAEEKLVEKVELVDDGSATNISQSHRNVTEKVVGKSWNFIKFLPSQQQASLDKTGQRPAKKPRIGGFTSSIENGDASSESDKEQSLTKYSASAIALENSPEEKKRRENRSRRFDRGQDQQSRMKASAQSNAGPAIRYTRKATAVLLAKSFEDSASRAVEDIDWDALTVKGTCQEVEKRYLRLTSAPDPTAVRPEDVLEKALHMVQTSQKNYLYKCDQLKSIRQDLTVQRIRNELTVKVYETHARLALQAGDLPEYKKCQSQLTRLYAEGIKGCRLEFSAYNMLCIILHSNDKMGLLSSMARLSNEAKCDEAVKHALAVHSAVSSGNYILFFRLYQIAPNLNTCLMDPYVESMRFEAVICMSKSYRPTVPIRYIARVLGFSRSVDQEDSEVSSADGSDECEEWLRAHGAILSSDTSGELHMDTKASSSHLYMPEPENAVAHGDASLAVDDFLTRAP